jgi:hypothetical protein
MSNREFFDERKYIEVIRKKILFVFFLVRYWRRIGTFTIEQLQIGSNFQLRHKVGLLEI